MNGNMFMGLFGPEVGLKLPEAEAHQVVASGGVRSVPRSAR